MRAKFYKWLSNYLMEHGKLWCEVDEDVYSIEWLPFGFVIFMALYHFRKGYQHHDHACIVIFNILVFQYSESEDA